MNENQKNILSVIRSLSPESLETLHRDQLTVNVSKDKIIDVLHELKHNELTQFDQLLDITAIDWINPPFRFEIVYFLWSNKLKHRVRLKSQVEENDLNYPSATSVYESANWYERETFDMYGIKFHGHPNLRRFYMPEDFLDPVSGEPLFPLRKDFPLMGVPDSLPLPPYPEKYGDIQ